MKEQKTQLIKYIIIAISVCIAIFFSGSYYKKTESEKVKLKTELTTKVEENKKLFELNVKLNQDIQKLEKKVKNSTKEIITSGNKKTGEFKTIVKIKESSESDTSIKAFINVDSSVKKEDNTTKTETELKQELKAEKNKQEVSKKNNTLKSIGVCGVGVGAVAVMKVSGPFGWIAAGIVCTISLFN